MVFIGYALLQKQNGGFVWGSPLRFAKFLNEDLIDCEFFVSLYNINTSNNLDLSYEIYDTLDLALLCANECRNVFRFYKITYLSWSKCWEFHTYCI